MRLVDELEILGDPTQVGELVRRLDRSSDLGWERDQAAEDRLRAILPMPADSFCFSKRGGDGFPGASLWLNVLDRGKLGVTSVVPADRRAFTDEEHNNLLRDFRETYLRALAVGLDIELRTVPAEIRLERMVSAAALSALKDFSATASRSATHALDLARWRQFLIQSHLDGSVLEGPDLDWWLARQGWADEPRKLLVDRYRDGLSLLANYDEERIAS